MYTEANVDLMRRLERDQEKEPRVAVCSRPRRKQFRYWAGQMFRPARPGSFRTTAPCSPPRNVVGRR